MRSPGRGAGDAPQAGADPGLRWLRPVALAVLRRPPLWGVAVRQARRLAPPGWWRQWPPDPVPPASYLRFRLETAYGGAGRPPDADDVVTYLRWCRQWRGLAERAG